MKAAALIILVSICLVMTSCSATPKAYKDDPCADFCFEQSKHELNDQYTDTYEMVVAPACKKIADYDKTKKGLMIRTSPTCDGEDSFCDCLLEDGTYLIEN